MRNTTLSATPLYMLLWHWEQTSLPKEVLDCGAGGKHPPLALFLAQGYRTAGLDSDPRYLEEAEEYCRATGFCESAYLPEVLGSPRFPKHGEEEANDCFTGCEIIRKEKRTIWTPHDGGTLTRAYVDYVVRKSGGPSA